MKQDIQTFFQKNNILYVALFIFISFSSSCKKSPEEIPEPVKPTISENVRINNWVTENMRIYYYWNQGIPTNGNLNFDQDPKKFFETIRNSEDRFSWIDKASTLSEGLSGISTSTGINFSLIRGEGNEVFGFMRYVIPKSPADLAGIERGVFFTKVNGMGMTISNYNEVLKPYTNGESFKLQLAKLEGNTIVATKEVDLMATKITEPSVYIHKVLTTASGRKVGYLFYNRFLNEKSDELFKAFQDFKAAGIQDLILDIRYNLGGGIAVSGLLSALIMQDYSKEKVFVEYNYNKDLNAYFDEQHRKDPVKNSSREKSFIDLYTGLSKMPTVNTADSINTIAKSSLVNLPRVFVLATKSSASASELVINNLKPYMEVVHIGDTTIGKNEGSITIEDEETPKTIDWAIQPIILKLANSRHFGDYARGLVPTIKIDEGYILKPLGDAQDPLVKAALERIDPSMAVQSRITPPRVSAMFQKIQKFDENHNKARPVLVDGTVDKNLLMKFK